MRNAECGMGNGRSTRLVWAGLALVGALALGGCQGWQRSSVTAGDIRSDLAPWLSEQTAVVSRAPDGTVTASLSTSKGWIGPATVGIIGAAAAAGSGGLP